jgi:receptor protein-tyrosine kinase
VETIQKLARRVMSRMDAKGAKSILITSVMANEGKSTVAVNLAIALAKKNRRVLLIDCDLHKPACGTLLEHKWSGYGVRDVLSGQAEPKDAITVEGSSGLYMMLEKKGGRDSGDLVASENMRELLDWARGEFDAVILDLPPISAVADAVAMADLADCSLLVVRQNAALAPALNKAIAALERGKAKMLGGVLNNGYETALFSGQGDGGYGYGYGYGKYGRYGKYGHYGHYGRYGAYDTNETGK